MASQRMFPVSLASHTLSAKAYCSMPTFLILKKSSVVDTIRGANPSGLRSAVSKASADASKGTAQSSTVFHSKGQRLGGEGPTSGSSSLGASFSGATSGLANILSGGFFDSAVRFIGLYVVSLFSLDAYQAASESNFRVR